MKKHINIAAILALAASWSAWAGGKSGTVPSLTGLNRVLDIYFSESAALARDDAAAAGAWADTLARVLGKPAPAKSAWEKDREPMRKAATEIAEAKDVDAMRAAFAVLSSTLAQAAGREGDQTTYLMECPMALGNKPAVWLQKEAEIANPYLGGKMLRCGGVKKML